MKKSLHISIADIGIRIIYEDLRLKRRLENIFSSYKSSQKSLFKIIITGNLSNTQRSSSPGYPVIIKENNGQFTIIEKHKKGQSSSLARYNNRKRSFHIELNHNINASNLISCIRISFHYFLEKQGGFYLHASSGKIRGKSVAFTGKHDSGKTTALRRLSPDSIIAEDALAITTKGKQPIFFATPFRRDKKSFGRADSLFFPKKSKLNPRIKKVNKASAVREIISNTFFSFPGNASHVSLVLKNISQFCHHVPSYSLYFSKTTNLQEVIV